MSIGPGKYDEEATWVREQTHAQGVIVVVFGGDRGEGFAAQLDLRYTETLPQILRNIADQIEADMKTGKALS